MLLVRKGSEEEMNVNKEEDQHDKWKKSPASKKIQ
jgi:hypothetical protein